MRADRNGPGFGCGDRIRWVACIVAISLGTAAHSQERQPDTIFELLRAYDHTLSNLLTAEERTLYARLTPRELREADREVYEKVSQNVVRWTDRWIAHIGHTLGTVPHERLVAATREAEAVDELLRTFFEAREWPYESMEVVFLPQRVFHDSRRRGAQVRGLFIPYYPTAFFATIDPSSPMSLVLVHESLHFNKRGRPYGRPLTEGITEMAARHIVGKHRLVSDKKMRRENAYETERRRVDVILKAMMEQTGSERAEALEILLEAYLSGNQETMYSILGKSAWDSVIELSHARRWYKSDIVRALGEDGD